jgi:hypothetical protein
LNGPFYLPASPANPSPLTQQKMFQKTWSVHWRRTLEQIKTWMLLLRHWNSSVQMYTYKCSKPNSSLSSQKHFYIDIYASVIGKSSSWYQGRLKYGSGVPKHEKTPMSILVRLPETAFGLPVMSLRV